MARTAAINIDNVDFPCQADLLDKLRLWQDWMIYEKNLSPHTIRAYLYEIRDFLQFFVTYDGAPTGLNRLGDLKPVEIRAFMAHRHAQGNQNATRARALSGLKHFFKWLDKQGYVHIPAIALVRAPKIRLPLPRPVSEKDAFALLDELRDTAREEWIGLRDQTLFMLLYGCGLRIDEALSLNYSDRPSNETIYVLGKRQKERQIYVLPIIQKSLDQYIKACPYDFSDGDTPLFLGMRGERLNAGVVQRSLRQLRGVLGLSEKITPHAFRHAFATHLLNNGMNLRMVQDLLGHETLSSTQRYTDVAVEDLIRIYKQNHPRA